jgi:hypothetical protein
LKLRNAHAAARRFDLNWLRYSLVLFVAALAGCGQESSVNAPVSGRITIDSRPLAGGNIVFQPVAGAGGVTAGRGSNGSCDDDGHFQLETVDGKTGAVVGNHRVRIYGPKPKRSSADDSGGPTDQASQLVPERYNYRTELTFVVPPVGTTQADFDLITK